MGKIKYWTCRLCGRDVEVEVPSITHLGCELTDWVAYCPVCGNPIEMEL